MLLMSINYSGCKEGEPTPPLLSPDDNYYPLVENSTTIFKVELLNAVSNYDSIGIHKIFVKGKSTISQTEYNVRHDSLFTNLLNSNGKSYLRKTERGVYSFIDTTGLTGFLPDTIKRLLTIDPEQILFSYPVQIGREWICYAVSLPGLSLIDFRAVMERKENVSFAANGVSQNLESLKIKYTLKLNIIGVDSTLLTQEYSGIGWYANDFGLVKYEGAQEILAAVSSAVYQLSGAFVKIRVSRIE